MLSLPQFSTLVFASFYCQPASAQSQAYAPDWRLVTEIIEDLPPDYRSDLYFVDVASLLSESSLKTISVSHIVQTQEGLQPRIQDRRNIIAIDCEKSSFEVIETALHDGEREKVEDPSSAADQATPLTPRKGSAYAQIIALACDPSPQWPDSILPTHMQPLDALLAYLNADWSK